MATRANIHPNETERAAAVEVHSATKRFENGTVALSDVSLVAKHGQFVSLIGPSGCGKSTMLRLVAGLLDVSSGSVRVNGDDVREPRPDVGMMFQQPTLLPWKTAIENVLLPAQLSGQDGADATRKARDLLHLLGLNDFECTYPQHLSGGMQQRVALARVLMMGVSLILLDEPFGALDEMTREHLNLELLRIVADFGATAILVTHNIPEAVFLSDEVVVLSAHPGRICGKVDISLPRPRTIDLQREPQFHDLTFNVRELLGMRS